MCRLSSRGKLYYLTSFLLSFYHSGVGDVIWTSSCSSKTNGFGLIGSAKLSTGVSENEFFFSFVALPAGPVMEK